MKPRVAYYYQEDIGHHHYGPGHPMKPFRMKLAHELILSYGLYRKMECYRPHKATAEELASFHSDDYVDFLRRVTPENVKAFSSQLSKFNCGIDRDCPVFSSLYGFCQSYAGASIDGATRLNDGTADVAVNWAGGLHHAKKSEASGFCYVNDIVLGILELLKHHARVLYIDIDVHHGDGVEEAFYTTDRVMCVSFHKYGDGFFPGTGSLRDVGAKQGKYYSVNFPLADGIDDLSYETVFKPVIARVMEMYRPGAVVLQCGADSLTEDKLGPFNLTLKGHAECVKFVRSFGLPTMLLGGGGYTPRNVARCWANETATALGAVLPDYIPPNNYIQYFQPDYRLHLEPSSAPNMNSREYLHKVRSVVLENLRYLEAAPSVQFQYVPPEHLIREVEAELKVNGGSLNPDLRPGQAGSGGSGSGGRIFDGKREHDAEYYDGEYDGDARDGVAEAAEAAVAAARAAHAAASSATAASAGAGAGAGGGIRINRKRRLDDEETEQDIVQDAAARRAAAVAADGGADSGSGSGSGGGGSGSAGGAGGAGAAEAEEAAAAEMPAASAQVEAGLSETGGIPDDDAMV